MIHKRGRKPMPRYYRYLSVKRRYARDVAPALARYRKDNLIEGEDRSTTVLSFLVDLRHYCDAHHLDLYRALDQSYDVYLKDRNS